MLLSIRKNFRNTFTRKNVIESIPGWLFSLPLILGLAIFTFYPMVYSLVISFYNYNGITTFQGVGWGNFVKIFTGDREIGKTVLNTLLYTVINVPMTMVLSYLLSLLVNKNLKGIKVYRLIYYLPCMIPAVVSGLVWADIMQYYGALNKILGLVGIPASDFFESKSFSAVGSIFLMNLWGMGGGMLIWLAALKNIPNQLYESADIDGAGKMVKLFKITIPMSTPMIFFNAVTSIIGTLQYNGTLTFAPNGGKGNGDSMYMYAVKIYRDAFKDGTKLGYASAMAWMLLLVIAVLTVLLFTTSKWVYYGEDK